MITNKNATKITLKEAFKAQTMLSNMINEGIYLIEPSCFKVVKTTHDYEKGGIKDKASIEDTLEPFCPAFDWGLTSIVDGVNDLIKMKVVLAEAIEKAKNKASVKIDTRKISNANKQLLLSKLSNFSKFANSSKSKGRGSMLQSDNEGKQTEFVYPTDVYTEYDFDKTKINAVIKRLTQETNDDSAEIELCQLTKIVEFDPESIIATTFAEFMILKKAACDKKKAEETNDNGGSGSQN